MHLPEHPHADCLPAEPSPSGQGEAPDAFPFLAAGGSPVQMADAGMQTGASLAAEDEEQAAAAADAAAGALHEDGYGGAGGGFEDAGDYEQPGVEDGRSLSLQRWVAAPLFFHEELLVRSRSCTHAAAAPADLAAVPRRPAADLPESSGAAEQRAQQAQRAQRKVTKNPGSRLRNELKRKSLAIGACCTLCAVLRLPLVTCWQRQEQGAPRHCMGSMRSVCAAWWLR